MTSIEEPFYLTDKLLIKNGKAYKLGMYDNKISINERNWLKWLGEYGWDRIDTGWTRRFSKYKKTRYCQWGILDCGANGDCLFEVIAEAHNQNEYFNSESTEVHKMLFADEMRKAAVDQINEDNFDLILESYKTACETGEFYEEWDPYDIKNIKELQNALRKGGNQQWGDFIMLQLLQKALKINFIILNSEDYSKKRLEERFTIHSSGLGINPEYKTIILYYLDQCHFQLIGYFKEGTIYTLFDYKDIPQELLQVYRKDCHYLNSD